MDSQLDEAQAGIKIARRKINNLKYADDPVEKPLITPGPTKQGPPVPPVWEAEGGLSGGSSGC